MGRLYRGCKEAREVSLTAKGANEHAVVLVTKNMAPEAKPETNDMDDVLKALAAMNEATRAHFLTLTTEDAQKAFLGLKPEEQTAAVEKAAKVEPVVDAAEVAKNAKTVEDMQKAFAAQQTVIDDIQKAREEDRKDALIEKRARTEFAGYPGGEEKVVPLLKAYAGLPDEARIASEAVLKNHIEFSRRTGTHLSVVTDEEMMKAMPATAEIEKKATELSAEKKVGVQVAKGLLMRDPANADLFARALAEEQQPRVA